MEQNKYLDIVCQVMNAAMKGEHLDLSDYVNDKEFLRIMEEQTFQSFLYKVDKRPEFRKYYIQAALISEKIDNVGNELKQILDENDINHIFLKGLELKKIYPDPCMRLMGDIDILVRDEDYEKTLSVLEKFNFERGETMYHHTDMKYKSLCIEVHNKLLALKNEHITFLDHPFTNAINIDKNTYTMNSNEFFLYLLIHYIIHMKKGAGLRELCDFYLFLKNNDIDTNFIIKELSYYKSENFLDTIFTELDYIFGFKKYDFKYNKNITKIIMFSLMSGIHGYGLSNQSLTNEFQLKKTNKFSYFIKKLFIPLSELFKELPWTKSIILIPIGYLVRLFKLIIFKRKKLISVLNLKEKSNIYDDMGINDNFNF